MDTKVVLSSFVMIGDKVSSKAMLVPTEEAFYLYTDDSCNIRTAFFNYSYKISELSGQRWHLITILSKMCLSHS